MNKFYETKSLKFLNTKLLKILCFASICILYLQMFCGGLLAGLKGGHIYNSFPLMNGYFIPPELLSFNAISLENPVFLQFVHRILAYILTLINIIIIRSLVMTNCKHFIYIAIAIAITLFVQVGTGIITLVYLVPIKIALIHQMGSIFLLSTVLYCYQIVKDDE